MLRFARPDRRRPVLVISRQVALDHLRTAVVAPITSAIRGLPSEIRVGVEEGLKKESVVNLDHLYTVEQKDLRLHLGRLDAAAMRDVCEALGIAMGCA
jgi:mRNA interferase MazF